ncbi:MAG: flippase, partial [Patescibacteria group bacterium]
MSKAQAIITHTIIQVISKGLNIALGLAAFSLLTQYLGQGGFGQYTIITTFLGIFGVIADMGLSIVAIQMMSERRDQESKVFNTILSIRIITALIALGLAPLIALLFPYSVAVKVGIALTFLSFFFSSLIQLFTALFQQRVAMVFPSYADAIGRIVLLGGVIAAMVFHQGLYEILIITVLANAIQCLLLYLKARKIFPIRIAIDKIIATDVFVRSWPIALSVTFNLIYLKADILILSLFRPEADVGLYGASYRILEVLVTIPMMFMGITLSSFADAWAQKDNERFRRYLQKSFDAMIIMAIPLIVGTILIAPDIMTFISGKEFIVSGRILQILILAMGMVFVGTLFGHLINIINAQRTMLWGYAAGAIGGLAGYL